MDQFEGTASIEIAAPAREVVDLVTNVERLPEWNSSISAVLTMEGAS